MYLYVRREHVVSIRPPQVHFCILAQENKSAVMPLFRAEHNGMKRGCPPIRFRHNVVSCAARSSIGVDIERKTEHPYALVCPICLSGALATSASDSDATLPEPQYAKRR
jgi:hypothetical protein